MSAVVHHKVCGDLLCSSRSLILWSTWNLPCLTAYESDNYTLLLSASHCSNITHTHTHTHTHTVGCCPCAGVRIISLPRSPRVCVLYLDSHLIRLHFQALWCWLQTPCSHAQTHIHTHRSHITLKLIRDQLEIKGLQQERGLPWDRV